MTLTRLALITLTLLSLPACGEDPRFKDLPPDARRGLEAFRRECVVCHNINASQIGVLGPAIAGSSRELLEARVLRLEYPPGYTPKQQTKQMFPALPHLSGDIDDLHAFLNPKYHPAPGN